MRLAQHNPSSISENPFQFRPCTKGNPQIPYFQHLPTGPEAVQFIEVINPLFSQRKQTPAQQLFYSHIVAKTGERWGASSPLFHFGNSPATLLQDPQEVRDSAERLPHPSGLRSPLLVCDTRPGPFSATPHTGQAADARAPFQQNASLPCAHGRSRLHLLGRHLRSLDQHPRSRVRLLPLAYSRRGPLAHGFFRSPEAARQPAHLSHHLARRTFLRPRSRFLQ